MRPLLRDLAAAIRHWQTTDPVLAGLAKRTPPRPFGDPRRSGFAALVVSLIHQQVSLAAGRSITRKVVAAVGGRITPKAIMAAGSSKLRAAGLSRQKRSYVQDLARRAAVGSVNFRTLGGKSDDDVIEALTRVRGIGTWTAKMFLLGHLARPDVVAPEDLGLRLAFSSAYGVPLRRTAALLEEKRAAWRPYGSLACLTLWAHKDQARPR